MKPKELEQTIRNYYGKDSISVVQDGRSVIILFPSSGEQRVNAVKAVQEFLGTDGDWVIGDDGVTNDMWVVDYHGP